MKKTFLLLSVLCSTVSYAAKVGLLVMATGKYIQFVEPLLASADQHFLADHEVTYFVFTDQEVDFHDRIKRSIVRIEQKRLGWPHDTLMRLPIYARHADAYENVEYLYAIDADMLFVDAVGEEVLANRVGSLHLAFVGNRGSYETNNQSVACVQPHEGTHYFAGGFNGGSKEGFLHMARTITENIYTDIKKGYIAVWHDESHINRYFIDYKPDVILSPSYCYPENRKNDKRYRPKLVALVKDHNAYRQ